MRLRAAITLIALTLAQVTRAADADPDCVAIENAFAANNLPALIALTPETARWRALQQFRLAAAYIPANDRSKARAAIRAGLQAAAEGLEANRDNVELLLLGAMLDGQFLLLSPWRFFTNGRRGLRRLGKAERLAPGNPRAMLIRGTSKVVLPRFLGGNAAQARDVFNAALAARSTPDKEPFAETALCVGGAWAQVDLLNWLGRAHDKLGDDAAAQAAYGRALARSPGNHWVTLAIEGRGYEWQPEEAEDGGP